MAQHLTPQDLRAFAQGELPAAAARSVVAHLLHGCAACRSESAELWYLGQPREVLPEDSYDLAFERLLSAVRGGNAERTAPAAAGWLQSQAGVAADVEGPALVDALIARAWELRHQDPEEMRRIARLAVLAAGGLVSEEDGDPRKTDLLSRAWAAYGNACRVADDLDEAQRALERAAELHGQGSGDREDRARLYEFQASLEAARGNYGPALAAVDAAYAIHLELGDRHRAGRALITKGLYTGHMGKSREAFNLTQRGLGMVDEEREPDLVLAAVHNQIWFLVESGRLREARSLLGAHRDRLAVNEAQRLDLLWLEGRIRAGLRDGERALQDLEAAERGFAAVGRRFQAANVKLDQAAVHLRRGDTPRALALVRAAEEAFIQLDAPQGTLMALAFLRRRLAERQIPATFVLRLADLVRRGQTGAARG